MVTAPLLMFSDDSFEILKAAFPAHMSCRNCEAIVAGDMRHITSLDWADCGYLDGQKSDFRQSFASIGKPIQSLGVVPETIELSSNFRGIHIAIPPLPYLWAGGCC